MPGASPMAAILASCGPDVPTKGWARNGHSSHCAPAAFCMVVPSMATYRFTISWARWPYIVSQYVVIMISYRAARALFVGYDEHQSILRSVLYVDQVMFVSILQVFCCQQ